jgi:anti-sigma factor RsiW
MTCRDFAGFLSDYLTGELPADVLAAFEAHISVCSNCVRYLAQYRDSIAFSRAALEAGGSSVPDDVPEDLIAAILTARSL